MPGISGRLISGCSVLVHIEVKTGRGRGEICGGAGWSLVLKAEPGEEERSLKGGHWL